MVIRPGQLHKDTQKLIGNEIFSDVKFRFQVVTAVPIFTPRAGLSSRSVDAMD